MSPAAARPLCVITWPGCRLDDGTARSILEAAGLDIAFHPSTGPRTPDALAAIVKDACAAVVSNDPFDATVIARAPKLRVIARTGVGLDSIDLEAATSAGVVVTRTDGAHAEVVAEHAVAMMLAVLRRLLENDRSVRRGEWDRAGELTPWSLGERCVGLIGVGRIGSAVARRLAGFGCEVIGVDPALSTHDAAMIVSLNELLDRADVVSLHVPLTPRTRSLIDARTIRRLREGTVLVNTSRGEIVDQTALVEALRDGHLGGAALDVFEQEPPKDPELFALSNVILSPHIAGFSAESIRELTMQAIESVVDVLAGRTAAGIVNPKALAHPRHA